MVFHYLNGYDNHLFVKNFGYSEGSIDCIPNNEERYINFAKKIQIGSYMKKVKKEKVKKEEEDSTDEEEDSTDELRKKTIRKLSIKLCHYITK